MPETQPGEMAFTSNMEELGDLSIYPSWLRPDGKKDNHPRKRGMQIFREGYACSFEESCTYCIGLKIPCIRSKNSKFGKCCSCTARDLHPQGVCRLAGQPMPDKKLSTTAEGKIKQVESDMAKVQKQGNAMSQDGFGQFQSLQTPSLSVPTSAAPNSFSSAPARSVRSFAPSPEPASMQSTFAAGPAHSGSDATLERVTVLENQVAQLEASFLKLRVKIQEIESLVGPTRVTLTPVADSAATANIVQEDAPIRRPSTMNIHKILDQPSPIELPAGPALTDVTEEGEQTPKHTVVHTEGFVPSNCICARRDDADSEMADAD